ncbi:SPARC-related modular calcium-binding protein 1-like protein [Euroglyphus maynei]|uniref:SPARC-related modular calcium-binding protein 1-like protein n=1 Tax=Euroglyphus maynei TaxID=6958 RepID=A0A1Y3BPM8_EURMA|nr:SPARC-related modular calcium-binding protein 1-like protein [Euroglyphus maynei]
MKKTHHIHHSRIWSFILLLSSHFLYVSSAENFSGQPDCWSQRINRNQNDFALECTDDGHFKPVQCDNKTGYCFCVDPYSGRPNTQTTTKNRQLDCNQNQNHKEQQQEQFHNHNHHQSHHSKQSSRRQPIHYSNPLKEFASSFQPIAAAHSQFKSMIDEIYLSQMESNHRSQLIGCADSMFDFCDRDHDLNVTRPEFIYCLNLQHTQALNEHYLQRRRQQRLGNGESSLLLNKATGMASNRGTLFNYDNLSSDNDPIISTSSITYGDQGSSIPLLMENTAHSNQTGSDRSGKRKEMRKDCNLIRANSIESARVNPHGLVFIPECTADGYYFRVQCHHMHCWCVSRVTGQPIKALNKNRTENLEACDLMRKGCDQRRRVKFHKQFRQRLSSHGFTCDSIFDQIDGGHDKTFTIEENEFKSFIRLWSPRLSINSRLKKCLRTEIHYCDQNDDDRLTRNEWIQCCNDNITVTNIILSSSSSSMNHHQFNAGRRDSGLYPGSNFFSTEFAEAYNQKKNRPRSGQNPLKILNSK